MWFRSLCNWFTGGIGKLWRCILEKPWNAVDRASWVILVRAQKTRMLIGM
jgi:hypothetical protein